MKSTKIIYWTTTALVAVLIGFTPILTWKNPESMALMNHLGYPNYFANMLNVFKVLGGLALLIPAVPHKIKEWAYAGFGIDFIAASVSFMAVDGFNGTVFIPMIAFVILAISYFYFHKVHGHEAFISK